MNKLESARLIVEQDGNCTGIWCSDCAVATLGRCANRLSPDKLAIAKQYIKEYNMVADFPQPKQPKATPEQPASITQIHKTIDQRQAEIEDMLIANREYNEEINAKYRASRDELKAELRELKRIKRAM